MAEKASRLLEEIHESWEKEKKMYAMYLRKSRADLELEALGEEETLARHKSMLYKLAEKHNIRQDQIVIYHELVSGDSIDERPEMQRLLEDVFAKQYAGVLCVEVERLARGNTKDQGEVAEAFQYSHTHIITPAKVYDPDNEYDQEYFEFGLFMSRREYKTIRRRLENGKKQSVEEGNYLPSRPPFGYDIVRKSKRDRYLVENPEESKYIRMIFDWYTEERKSIGWICRTMEDMGIPTFKGGEWERTTISDMLRNVHYIGRVRWGRQETVKVKDQVTGKTRKKTISNSGKEQIFKGKHDGIISEEQFEKAQSILGQNARVKVGYDIINPLASLVVCANCGKGIRFYKAPEGRNDRYTHQTVKGCKMKSEMAYKVIDALVEALKQYISDFEIRIKNSNENDDVERHSAMIAEMEKELSSQNKRKRRLMDEWDADDCVYTREEFIERKQMYTRTIEALEERIASAKANTPQRVDYSERITTLHALIDCIRDPEISAKEKNIFLKQHIEKITYATESLGRGKGAIITLDVFLK